MDTQLLPPRPRDALAERSDLVDSLVHELANQLQHAIYAIEAAVDEVRRQPGCASLRAHLAEGLDQLDRGIDTAHRIQDVRRTLVGAAAPVGGDTR